MAVLAYTATTLMGISCEEDAAFGFYDYSVPGNVEAATLFSAKVVDGGWSIEAAERRWQCPGFKSYIVLDNSFRFARATTGAGIFVRMDPQRQLLRVVVEFDGRGEPQPNAKICADKAVSMLLRNSVTQAVAPATSFEIIGGKAAFEAWCRVAR